MAESYALRVWMRLHCSDGYGWIYRDVQVPVPPRMLLDGTGDFNLTGLFKLGGYMKYRGSDDPYIKGQPEETLFDICYDLISKIWHARVSEHEVKMSWEQARATLYRDWSRPAPKQVKVVDVEDPEKQPTVDPKTSVSSLLKLGTGAASKSSVDRVLQKILYQFGTGENGGLIRPLQVGDLAGKTYEDIQKIKGVGRTTLNCLVEAGLIPPKVKS